MTNRIHPLVLATIGKLTADAQLRLETLRSKENTTPATTRSSNDALRLAKMIREQQAIVTAWTQVDTLAMAQGFEPEPAPEFAAADAPERTVGWISDRFKGGGEAQVRLVCNGASAYVCRSEYPSRDWHPVTADQLPDGGFCDHCNTDVLA